METSLAAPAAKPLFFRSMLEVLAQPFNYALAISAAAILVADIGLARLVDLGGLSAFLGAWPALLLIAACTVYCISRPLPRLVDTCVIMLWGIVLSNLLGPLILIAGRSPRPLQDARLWAIDQRLHFSTASAVHLAQHLPSIRIILGLSYPLVGPMVIVALLVPPLFGKAAASRRFLIGAAVSALITAACFALWPAAGPWTQESFHPSQQQAEITAYLQHLKSPGPAQVDLNETAIVSFPSFHVALALITAWGLGSLRRLQLPAWIVTALICLSTLTTGWHYAIDVLGGAAVGMISIAAAAWIDTKLSKGTVRAVPL
jgi:membrane-associated phospholipid phosphatase